MIKTDRELKRARDELLKMEEFLDVHREHLLSEGIDGNDVERLMVPLRSGYLSLNEDIMEYEGLKFAKIMPREHKLSEIGLYLIKCRIFCNMSRRELADRLNVDPSQVSRDERNEYYGITARRADEILTALGMKTVVEPMDNMKDVNVSVSREGLEEELCA